MDITDALASTDLLIARVHDARIKEIDREIQCAWVEMAEIAVQVRDNEEYLLLGFHSFGSWLQNAVPRSRSTVYAAIGLLEELHDVPKEELRQIGIGNAHILKVLPRSIRGQSEMLDAAKALSPKQFRTQAIASAPDSHIEPLVNPRFRFSMSQWRVIEEAIAKVMEQYDGEITTREEALEALCAEWRLEQ